MFDPDFLLTVAAFVKWIRSEPLSKEDMGRIIKVLGENELKISSADAQVAAGIQVQLRHILNEKYGGPKPQ